MGRENSPSLIVIVRLCEGNILSSKAFCYFNFLLYLSRKRSTQLLQGIYILGVLIACWPDIIVTEILSVWIVRNYCTNATLYETVSSHSIDEIKLVMTNAKQSGYWIKWIIKNKVSSDLCLYSCCVRLNNIQLLLTWWPKINICMDRLQIME